MLDIKYIRENARIVKENNRNRGVDVDVDRLLKLDEQRRSHIAKLDEMRALRNQTSHSKPSDAEILRMREVGERIAELEKDLEQIESEYTALMYRIPNSSHPDVPVGKDESENKVLREVGEIPQFNFEPKDHMELGEKLEIIDVERATKVTGARFSYLKGAAALLEVALIQHVVSTLVSAERVASIAKKAGVDPKPFIPVFPPVMIKPNVFERMGRLSPEDKDERYYLQQDDLYLIGSAEHTLGSMHMDEILDEKKLPLRYLGFSTSFRREAGSYGKDTRGILRVHQFDKLELESFTLPGKSLDEQNFFVAIQEHVLASLELPYRVMMICTGDMGKPDARQIDMEVYLPGQKKYRETHTADLMTDFQARRLNTRVRKENGEISLVHTNDATAAAIGRMIIAILENYQTEKGTIRIPKVLQPYMGGMSEIS